MIDRAIPGQILIGDFQRGDRDGADASDLNTLKFIDKVQPQTSRLRGLKLAGEAVADIRCYLTGQRQRTATSAFGDFALRINTAINA